MYKKITYSLLFGLILLSSFTFIEKLEDNSVIQLLTHRKDYEAGSQIILKFSGSQSTDLHLYCSNSYGSSLVKPKINNDRLEFTIPSNLSNKTGVISWQLISNSESLVGYINILPKQEVASMETYIGPPSIQAGETDYSMLVVIPTDYLDNPIADSTQVDIKFQFLNIEKTETVFTKNLFAYKNIYSQTQQGRYLISSESMGMNSKEFDITVMPSLPTNFNISFERHHEYADGNQITTFLTSIIKDKYNNIVSDGTYVEFYIKTENNTVLKTSGNTVDGIASAKMIHPDHESNWTVKAIINGMAESNSITIQYKKAITDFDVIFSKNNRQITIGPLQSFMNQIIPDGLLVELSIHKNHQAIKTITKNSNHGFVTFILNSDEYLNNQYNIKVKTAGIEKTFKNISLW